MPVEIAEGFEMDARRAEGHAREAAIDEQPG